MSAYTKLLDAAIERENAAWAEQQRQAQAVVAAERLAPLDTRLARVLKSIPLEVQREGLSLAALQESLKGRSRGNCHPGELGSALRRLGFQRKRSWQGDDGFRALWFPATISKVANRTGPRNTDA